MASPQKPRRVGGLYLATYVCTFIVLTLLVALNLIIPVEELAGGSLNLQYLMVGWPRTFWWFNELTWPDFCFDFVVWSTILVGFLSAAEAWISRNGRPQLSLVSLLATFSGVAMYLSLPGMATFANITAGLNVLICICFAVAVTGWARLATQFWSKLTGGWAAR